MAQPYDGWTIRYGFLGGNLGDDNEVCGRADDFADCVLDALLWEYPGAAVQVPHQDAAGTVPYPLRTAAFDAQGDEVPGEVRNITRVAEEIFYSGVWLD